MCNSKHRENWLILYQFTDPSPRFSFFSHSYLPWLHLKVHHRSISDLAVLHCSRTPWTSNPDQKSSAVVHLTTMRQGQNKRSVRSLEQLTFSGLGTTQQCHHCAVFCSARSPAPDRAQPCPRDLTPSVWAPCPFSKAGVNLLKLNERLR